MCHRSLERCDSSCSRDLVETPFFMTCLNLRGRRCLVVGAGPVGLEKVEGLLAAEADVHVVALRALPEIELLAREGSLTLDLRAYRTDDLEGAFLVFAATADTDLNVRVFQEAEACTMLVNVVDVPPLCNFIMPAIARVGPISIAVSTRGASPALAKRLRSEIAERYGEPYAQLAEMLNEIRGWARDTLPTYHDRKRFFEDIVHAQPDPIESLRRGDAQAVRELIALHVRAAESAGAPA
ncbi:MAG: precorrin-2 dehydrogenase [Gaiellales bacterium]|nr:precorrin-2 dehydrogenase [Gaiellales bacterium]